MVRIRINGKKVDVVMDMVRILRSSGLRQGIDFDFSYHRPECALDGTETDRYTLFIFYDDKHATLFSLKYAS